ncbi:MAG TPA: crossover junction endodeoxyribonuclease RuvC [Actinomycetota bacterium]|nr:crossover junction endodeoxyribonuclease RuvC [Actinomycetota bacterium]
MRVIGIDPGVATTGYAIVDKGGSRLEAVTAGVVRTQAGTPAAERLLSLRRALDAILREHRPDVFVIERLFFNANVRTAMAVGQAAGVALLCAAEAGLETCHYTPLEVKLSVVGVGRASKAQVQAMVAALLRLPQVPRPSDAADACALAICHLNRSGLAAAVARAERVG